ncbi:MAG TPA: hypothetical protein VN754_08830, partial [Candidatus Binataceae bacterium]|nr:hypothetical protein [Candidatus Binataceae bacterium]
SLEKIQNPPSKMFAPRSAASRSTKGERQRLLHIRLGYSELPSNSRGSDTSFKRSADSVQLPWSQRWWCDFLDPLLARRLIRHGKLLASPRLPLSDHCRKQSV